MSTDQRQLREPILFEYGPVAALILLFLVADIGIATVVNARGDEAGGIVVGLVFSQIVLLATWTALGPASVFVRTASGVLAASLLALTLVSCIRNSGVGENVLLWFVITMTQWAGIQVPLWVLRLCFGWRLCWPGEEPVQAAHSELQFGLRQLMAWTALVGMTLGIGRWLLPEGGEMTTTAQRTIVGFSVITTFNCLLAWPIIWATLTRYVWAWLAVAAICYVGVTVAETEALTTAAGGGGDTEFFWFMNAIQAVAASVSLLALRFSGFTLIRPPKQ